MEDLFQLHFFLCRSAHRKFLNVIAVSYTHLDASAAALAHPPISGASSIPGKRDESKGSGASPAFSATPGNAVTAMQEMPAIEKHSEPMDERP